MLAAIKQALAIAAINLGSLRNRLGASSVIVVGIAGVVGVITAMLAMAEGFQQTLEGAGRTDQVVLLSTGSSDEMSSGITRDVVDIITSLPDIARDAENTPLASPEVYVVSNVPKRTTDTDANMPVRGVTLAAPELREDFAIIEGRMFQSGRNEMIVGRSAVEQFKGLDMGSVLSARGSQWTVVGIFSTGGNVYESEAWVDATVAQTAFRRGNVFQSIRLRLEHEDAFDEFIAALETDRRVQVNAMRETDYFTKQSQALSATIRGFGFAIGLIMAIGAIFGALNTMYSAVSARKVDIATLRALGFGSFPVVTSILLESLILALAGGILGGLGMYFILNGYTISTLNNATFSQVVFDFMVTPELLLSGIVIALLLGLIGGLLPALRAARVPIAVAFRDF